MGQTQSKGMFPESRYYTVLDYGYCRVWKRKDTHKQTMEEYNVSIENQHELQKYQKMWQLRTQEEDVVAVYYFNNHSAGQICSVTQHASILTERIPYRLSQFCNIPYREILSLLRTCLKAFKILYTEYGLFRVRSTMLGINCQRQLKVWHHTDFSTPQPENSNCKSLLEMLQSIIQAVEANADQPFEFVRFSQFLNANRERIIANFDQMLKVLQTYRKMNKIASCQGLPEISYYLRQAEGWEEISFNTNFVTNLSNLAQHNSSSPHRDYISPSKIPPALNQSHKTIKRSPSKNIYTHREINHNFQSSNQHQQYFRFREQRLNMQPNTYQTSSPKVPYHYSPNSHSYPHLKPVIRYQNSLQKRESGYAEDNRRFNPGINRRSEMQGEIRGERVGMSSIERRVYEPERNVYKGAGYRFGGQLARPVMGHERRGRLEISSVRSNSLSNSKSKESSFIYI